MYGASTEVVVKAIELDRRILIVWDNRLITTEMEWRFETRGADTWVKVESEGVAKVWSEHGIEPGFVVNRFSEHQMAGWSA